MKPQITLITRIKEKSVKSVKSVVAKLRDKND